MNPAVACIDYPISFWKRCVAAIVGFHFLAALALAAFPQLHEALHHFHASEKHQCAATLLADGAIEGTALAPVCPAPLLRDFFLISLRPALQLSHLALAGQSFGRAPPAAV